MYAQSLNAVASDTSVRVAVEERLKAVEIQIFNRRVDFALVVAMRLNNFQPHFNRTSTVPGSFLCRLRDFVS